MTITPPTLQSRGSRLRLAGQAAWRWLEEHLWLLLPGLAVGALWPFYREGFTRSYDGGLHLLRISLLEQHLRSGMLYPRWAPELLLGHGYPVFSFYGPATYYLVVLLHGLGLPLPLAFMAACGLQVIGAGVGMYLFARDLWGTQPRWAAFVAAVAYLYSPYLLTNIFIRGALAEAAAQALLPWIFWSCRRLIGGQPGVMQPSRYLLPFVLTLGALALTHNITLLFLPPVLLGFGWLQWQQLGRPVTGLGRVVAGILLAMGLSAFFWIPLIGERTYLTDTPYKIAQQIWLPLSVWRWDNFLDWGLRYTHSFDRPIRLGLLQLVLASLGFVLVRRTAETWFWAIVALCGGLGIGAWTLPVWENSRTLSIAQFPWRLLSIVSLPLALLVGGLVMARARRCQPVWAILLVALVIYTQQPRLAWMKVFPAEALRLTTAVFTQIEVDKGAESGGEGNSSIQEFRPRWVGTSLELDPLTVGATTPLSLTLTQANAFTVQGELTTATPTVLRWQSFYFPGWQATLDQQPLQPYPSTNLGLLTLNVPAGRHQVQITWNGTRLQSWAGVLSLLTLALLAGVLWQLTQQRRWVFLPLLLLLWGLYARTQQPALQPVLPPSNPVAEHGLQLLGYRWEQQAEHLLIYPYWYVTQPPPEDLRVRWQLQDRSGQSYATLATLPYYNSYRASNFPVGTLVDDAYQLPLPPDLAAGDYELAVHLEIEDDLATPPPTVVGQWHLSNPIPPQTQPTNPLHLDFGKKMRLGGYDLLVGNRRLPRLRSAPAVVYNGDYLWYRLYWQAGGEIDQNYHGLIHLLDQQGQPLVKQDQLPGPVFHPPLLWDRYRWQTDTYLLRLPDNAPSGLYWPAVGAYEFETVKLLPITNALTQAPIAPDYYRLPPVKLVNRQPPRPQQQLDIGLADWGRLTGFTLNAAQPTLQAGASLTVTLFYRADRPVRVNYTRFVHLANANQGLLTQFDSQPQAGANPTWSWQPGEVVVDSVVLQLPATAVPGSYTLYVGFYDPQTDGLRLPLLQADGTPVLDNRVPFHEIVID